MQILQRAERLQVFVALLELDVALVAELHTVQLEWLRLRRYPPQNQRPLPLQH